ncbi:hypothetical protein H9P43_008091 [Blastocladiella emersonii ATCC 22665]|nr:hypothetical protein H9P43_008091 [Blastocladiella emersonii ATCC 22665]
MLSRILGCNTAGRLHATAGRPLVARLAVGECPVRRRSSSSSRAPPPSSDDASPAPKSVRSFRAPKERDWDWDSLKPAEPPRSSKEDVIPAASVFAHTPSTEFAWAQQYKQFDRTSSRDHDRAPPRNGGHAAAPARGSIARKLEQAASFVHANAALDFMRSVHAIPWPRVDLDDLADLAALRRLVANAGHIKKRSQDARAAWCKGVTELLVGLGKVPNVRRFALTHPRLINELCIVVGSRNLTCGYSELVALYNAAQCSPRAALGVMKACASAGRVDDVLVLAATPGVPPLAALQHTAAGYAHAERPIELKRLVETAVAQRLLEHKWSDMRVNAALLKAAEAQGGPVKRLRLLEQMVAVQVKERKEHARGVRGKLYPIISATHIAVTVNHLAAQGHPDEAQRALALFDALGMPWDPDAVHALVVAQANAGEPEAVIALLGPVGERFAGCTSYHFETLLHAHDALGDMHGVRKVHARVMALADERPASGVQDRAKNRPFDRAYFHSLIHILAREASPTNHAPLHEAMDVFRDMVKRGIKPTQILPSALYRHAAAAGNEAVQDELIQFLADPTLQLPQPGVKAKLSSPAPTTDESDPAPPPILSPELLFVRDVEPLLRRGPLGNIPGAIEALGAIMSQHGPKSVRLNQWSHIVTAVHQVLGVRSPDALTITMAVHRMVVRDLGWGAAAFANVAYVGALITALSRISTAQNGCADAVVVALVRRWVFGDTSVVLGEPWDPPPAPEGGEVTRTPWNAQLLCVAIDALGFAGAKAELLELVQVLVRSSDGAGAPAGAASYLNTNVFTSLVEAAMRVGDGELALDVATKYRQHAGVPADAKLLATLKSMAGLKVAGTNLRWVPADRRFTALAHEVRRPYNKRPA